MAYSIEYAPEAVRALDRMPHDIRRRIILRIESLADGPRRPGAVKLSGCEAYRIRAGDYRVIYGIADQRMAVLIVCIAHRREVYRGF